MPTTRKRLYLGTMPKGVSSPCGLVTSTSRADGGAKVVGHVFAEDDGRHGGDALLHALEGVGRLCGARRSLCVVAEYAGVAARGCEVSSSSGRGRSFLHRIQQVSDFALVLRNHAFEHGAARARAARDQHLFEDRRSGGDDVRLLRRGGP